MATRRRKPLPKTNLTLNVPDQWRDAPLSATFHSSTWAVLYADRLGASGLKTIGDLHGKTENEIRALAKTRGWDSFKSACADYKITFI